MASREILLFLLLCAIWGTTWIAMKFGIETVPPLLFAGTRFLAAGLVLAALLALRRSLVVPAIADIPRLLAVSLLVMTTCYGLLFWGVQYVSSGLAAVLEMSLTPVALLAFALMLGDERFSRRRAAAIVLGVAGIVILFAPAATTEGSSLAGLAAVSGAALVYGWGAVLSRPLMARYSSLWLACVTMVTGGALLLGISLLVEPRAPAMLQTAWPAPAIGGWLFLVLFGSLLGYTIYLHLLRVWGSSRSGSYAFVSSVVAVAAGHLVFGEDVSRTQVAGMAVLLAAAWFAIRPDRERAGCEVGGTASGVEACLSGQTSR
ncbi:DMT family transporter [Allosphingosinicella deserti]|uniref:EamA family transporter n=1 Tax=Allosphingosinicella deserti TaxID=2116704 RepID=A0A2P7QM49_9SPHN|nr:EamA family transporter [Sphingomonas deserti]PSJ39042.1 EamA family transporter [Sphingomonas deserti]